MLKCMSCEKPKRKKNSRSTAMSSIEDIRPSLLIARAFGLAPYSITKSSVTLSKEAVLYSVPWLLIYLYAMYNRLDIYFQGDDDIKFRVLNVTRTILAVVTLTFDMVLCIARDSKLQSALNIIRKYDLTVKYDVGERGKILRIHTWTVFCFLIIYFLVIGWFTYFYEPYESLMAAFIYIYLYLPLSVAAVKFVSSVASIFLRFRHLNSLLFPGFFSVLMEIDNEAKRFHLRDICWLHNCLSSAVEAINSLYSAQLLLWFANFTFNTITRINDFTESESKETAAVVAKFIRDGGLVLLFVLLVSLMAAVCHFTAAEDKFAIGQYFSLHEVHFTAASGLFRINLPLLLKGGSFAMVQLSDIKPLLHAARFFGCGPHVVGERDVRLSTPGLAYSGLWALGFACSCSYGLYLIAARGHEAEPKLVALAAARTLLAYLCFFGDGIVSIRSNERLRAALLQLRSFDAAVGYDVARPGSRGHRRASWLAVATAILFWLCVGFITYKCDMTSPLFNAIIYVIANAAISMQLIKFAGLLILLHQRFRYLRILLQPEGTLINLGNSDSRDFAGGIALAPEVTRAWKGISSAVPRHELQLQDIRWLHCTLSNAADTVNSMYSMQLLFWLATMWLNSLSRIYAISESLAGTTALLPKIRESLLVIAYIANMLIITTACHLTAHEANAIGKAAFKPQSAFPKKLHSLEQTVEIGIYFNLRELHFSAAGGFIYIDLPLLLSIAGTMTTYLVVLHNNT